MPRHWKEPGEPGEPENSDPWYDVRELTTGQAVQLRQSLLRLASRAHGKVLARIFRTAMLLVPSQPHAARK